MAKAIKNTCSGGSLPSVKVGAKFHPQCCAWFLRGLSWEPVCYSDCLMPLEPLDIQVKGIWAKNYIKLMTSLNFLMGIHSKYMKQKRSKTQVFIIPLLVWESLTVSVGEASLGCSSQTSVPECLGSPAIWFPVTVLVENMSHLSNKTLSLSSLLDNTHADTCVLGHSSPR